MKRGLPILVLTPSFWSSGVFLIRFMSSYQLWSGWTVAALFVASPVLAVLSIYAVRGLLHLPAAHTLPTVTLLTGFVALLHGAALIITPALYGPANGLLPASIWLVWFCGSVLVPAVIIHHRTT